MKKVVLKRKISNRIANGHPWIFANEINLMDDELMPGDIATVETHDGSFVGKGYVNPLSRIPVRLLTRKKNDEINAAFFHAAQLMAFTLGLYPSFKNTVIRIIPIHPCAKILVNLPEGQTVHNLGFDTTNSSGADTLVQSNHVPTQSITLFLALLSEQLRLLGDIS